MRHHLAIPAGRFGAQPGEEARLSADGTAVACTFFSSDGWAVALVEPGPLELRIGRNMGKDVRWPQAPDHAFTMPNRDSSLSTPKMGLTATVRLMLRVRNMTHEQRIAHEWSLDG